MGVCSRMCGSTSQCSHSGSQNIMTPPYSGICRSVPIGQDLQFPIQLCVKGWSLGLEGLNITELWILNVMYFGQFLEYFFFQIDRSLVLPALTLPRDPCIPLCLFMEELLSPCPAVFMKGSLPPLCPAFPWRAPISPVLTPLSRPSWMVLSMP
uniref:Uncharacterized protein n=1 Tax=Molossus molossus TaxID=27622 RepID=A0A7J8DTB9_MOLMO|nr:hypothetical protein HJG59_009091 [Molossus molossus]